MNDPIHVVSGKTDAEKAKDYRAEITPMLEQACKIIDRARADGLVLGFSLGPDQFGRQVITALSVTKPL